MNYIYIYISSLNFTSVVSQSVQGSTSEAYLTVLCKTFIVLSALYFLFASYYKSTGVAVFNIWIEHHIFFYQISFSKLSWIYLWSPDQPPLTVKIVTLILITTNNTCIPVFFHFLFVIRILIILYTYFFSDVKFKIGPNRKAFYAHRCILSARSAIFKALFAEQTPNRDVEIPLPDTSPEIFQAMLEFMYTNCVSLTPKIVSSLFFIVDYY